MLFLPSFIVLFNVIILAAEAQQLPSTPSPPSLQPQAQHSPSPTQPPTNPLQSSSPALQTEPQLPPQVPTKPPLVQLTRATTNAAQPFLSTSGFIPSSSIITIDVSQPPTPPTSAPSTQPPKLNKLVQAAQETSPTTPVPSTPLQASNVSSQPQENSTTPPPLIIAPPQQQTSADFSSLTTPSPPIQQNQPEATSSPLQQPIPPRPSTPLPPTPTSAPFTNRSRSQEFKKLSDSPTTGSSSTSANVQFLKPKSKFKCSQSSECTNGGMCFNGICFCPPGYTGDSCGTNIDECRQMEEPCFNNGTCIDEVNQFRCECVAGFKGERCAESVDMCVGSPCLNGATCTNLRTDYLCQCEPGWEGRHCEKNIDECLKNPCQNNGTCLDLVNDYRCDCGQSGFTGKNCEVDFDDCAAKPCGFGTKECVDLTGDFKCICHEGFTGKRCEIDIDECQANPCENNGTCIEKSLNIHVHHLNSNSSIEHTIYEQNISSSTNMSQYAGFTCECKEEYYGDRCEEKKKCYTRSVLELCNHQQADCVNVGSSYECLINASFDGSGKDYAIYRVNGEFKVKEIYVKYRSLTGGIIMSFETTQPGSPIADLQLNKSGLYLSGAPIKRDETIKFDELLDGNEREIRLVLDTPTEIKSITLTRQTLVNDFHPAFKGCLMQVRLNNQLVPFVDYGFSMNHSFELVEKNLDVGQCRTCFEKDCLNDGHCEFQEGYDHCFCTDNFTGNFCEIDVNECEKNFNLCGNGGSCENSHGGYRCNCKEGFKGKNCQEISDYCKAKQPCATGTCKNVNLAQGTYQCECPSSHIGKKCERRRDCLNECHNHHSHCVNNVTCACLPGRREERIMCEYVASCEQVEGELCLNGGTCKNLETGGYHCICPEPFHGPICQFLIEKPQFDVILLIVVTCVGFLMAACAVVSLVIFRSVRKARATRGTYSPSTQEKFGNSASDLLKPPQPERLI